MLIGENRGGLSIGRSGANQASGELIEIGLANNNGAGGSEISNNGSIIFGVVFKCGAGSSGRKAFGINVVFHCVWNAV